MGHFIIPIAFIKEWIHHQIQWFLNGLFAPEVIRNSIPVPHVTYRGTGRQTPLFPPPSFKEEVEGLLELVACDCVLMRERLQRGDKAPSSGWEVLGGIRIIIKKRHVFKKHTMEQGRSCHPPLLRPFIPPSLHPSTPPDTSQPIDIPVWWSAACSGMWHFLSSLSVPSQMCGFTD